MNCGWPLAADQSAAETLDFFIVIAAASGVMNWLLILRLVVRGK